MVCYDYDTNSIQAVATKTCNAAELRDATMSMLHQLSISGHPPKIHILDNEAPVRPRPAPFRSDPRRMRTRSRALAQMLTHEYDAHINHLYNPVTGNKETYDSLCAQDPEKWERSFANEIGRLASGVGDRMPSGKKHNMFFIPRAQVPDGRKVTYANAVCDYRPLKDDPYWYTPISPLRKPPDKKATVQIVEYLR